MKLRTIFDLSLKNLQHAYFKLTGQRQRIVPYKVLVELTTQCNSKCKYCDIWKIKREDTQKIDLAAFELFLKKMDRHLLWLALSGGEITTNNQYPEIIRLIRDHCPRLRILTFTTNGLMPQRVLDFALQIRQQLDCDTFITISLDGDEQTHDTIRGIPGNYARCMETYELLRSHGIEAHFGITVAEGNHEFIKNSYHLYRDKIKAVTFVHTGGIFLTPDQPADPLASQKTAASLATIYRHYRVTSPGEWLVRLYIKIGVLFARSGQQTNIIPCDVGQSSAHLMANGDLKQCMFLPAIVNIHEGFDPAVYHSPAAEAMLEEIRRDKCPHCWMSCYGPHNILQAPLKSLSVMIKPL